MKRFDNVTKFEQMNKDNEASKIVLMSEDFAKHKINEMFGNKYSVEKLDKEGKSVDLIAKGEKLQSVFMSELERRSGVKMADFGEDVISYSMQPTVKATYAVINKIMVDTMTPIFYDQTMLNLIATTHFGGYGDEFKFDFVDPSLYDVSKVGRGQKHLKTQTKKKTTKNILTDMYGLTSIASVSDVLMGRVNIAEESARQAMSIAHKIYAVAVKELKDQLELVNGTNLVLQNYSETNLLKALREGSARNGEKMTIVGDAVALKTLLPTSTWTKIDLSDPYNTTTGYMAVWNGYTVIAFDVVADGTSGVVGLPTDRIYGLSLGDKGIHIALGATLAVTDDMFANDDLTINTTLMKEIGVGVATTRKAVLCKLA